MSWERGKIVLDERGDEFYLICTLARVLNPAYLYTPQRHGSSLATLQTPALQVGVTCHRSQHQNGVQPEAWGPGAVLEGFVSGR
jgi:hypothetical protein